MFTKRKLAKLMEQKEPDNQNINYEILEKAKQEAGWNDVGGTKVIDNRKQRIIIAAVACCLLLIIALGMYLSITLTMKKDNVSDSFIKYSYNENNRHKIDSVQKYNTDHKRNILYFADLQNVEETVILWKDKDKDVLLEQEVLLLDNYEHIDMYVQLESNYIIEFLYQFESLEKNITIAGTNIKYQTIFDDQQYLFMTYAMFTYKGLVYRINFQMLGEKDWMSQIEGLLT